MTSNKVSMLEEAAQLYVKGEFRKSFSIYAALAEEGHVLSQRFLGWLYFRGEGVEADLDKALVWRGLVLVEPACQKRIMRRLLAGFVKRH